MADGRPARIAASADVAASATIGAAASVWDLVVVRAGAVVGRETTVGRGAFIDTGVLVGARCKIQNDALLYAPATLSDGVFVGPAVVFTNDTHPRAIAPDGSLKGADDWMAVGVDVHEGASVGARAVCVAPVVIGAWSMVAAGAVVVRDVPPHALVAGVPARQIAWVGRSGHRLVDDGQGRLVCPDMSEVYREVDGELVRVE